MQLGSGFKEILKQIETEKGISEEMIVASLEAAMVSAYKKFKESENERDVSTEDFDVEIDVETGELRLYEIKTVVSESSSSDNNANEISVDELEELGYENVAVGETVKHEIDPENFGRIAATTARQVITQRLKDAERQLVFEEFADKIGTVITAQIFKNEGDQVLVRLNEKTEAIMPKEEKIVGETYVVGHRMKFYLLDVRPTTKGPRIILSRTHPGLLKSLMEIEVPEIQSGIVEIKNIVRETGTRAKIAVSSLDPNVDPLGACVGKQGARIRSISNELNGERIDIIVWDDDILTYIKNSLSPAKVISVEPVVGQDKAVTAYVYENQLSLAIGKAGQNVRLAARLTGWKIDIKVKKDEQLPTIKDLFNDIVEDGLF